MYLLRSDTHAQNRVVTIKSSAHVTPTRTEAILRVRTSTGGVAYYNDYSHDATIAHSAGGRCLAFYGTVVTTGGDRGHGGRDAWGDCG